MIYEARLARITQALLEFAPTVSNSSLFPTLVPEAAPLIVTDWKEVNGWDFWRYLNRSSRKWEKIGKLR